MAANMVVPLPVSSTPILYPWQLIHLYYPTECANYLCDFLVSALVPYDIKTCKNHSIGESKFIYRMVSTSQEYKLLYLASAELVELIGRLIGVTYPFGIRKHKS